MAVEPSPPQSSARPRKRSLTIAGHRTSISLEDAFWEALHELAAARHLTPTELIAEIDAARAGDIGLSSAIRVAILAHYRARAGDKSER